MAVPQNYDFAAVRSSIALAQAASKNCKVVEPKTNELFVDIDDVNGKGWFNQNIRKVESEIGCTYVEMPSPSGEEHHQHIVVTLNRDVTPLERILLQTCLGSDRKREMLSWIRFINDDPIPTLFFEKLPEMLAAAPEPLGLLGTDELQTYLDSLVEPIGGGNEDHIHSSSFGQAPLSG